MPVNPSIIQLSSLNGTNGFRLSGVAANDISGHSVASAGDVNGDGIDDLIIGADSADPNGTFSGSSYVVFGKTTGFTSTLNLASLDGSTGFRLDGVAGYDFSGISVASAGDVNGDGFADIIIGASGADPNGSSSGSSYVVFGKASGFASTLNLASLDGSTGFRIDGEASEYSSGRSTASAGDVNGDGFDDVIVGAQGADPNGNSSGSSYVVFGKASGFTANLNLANLDGISGFRIDGVASYDFSGHTVASAGDVNGDGFDDLIIGANGADPNGSLSGSSYVVFGKATGFASTLNLASLDGSTGFRIDGVATNDLSGRSTASAGDVNGDGFDDIIIGAYGADPGGNSFAGESYVVFGKATGFTSTLNLASLDGSTGFRIDGVTTDDYSGRTVASAGDVNGDGFDDIIIGAYGADPGGNSFAGESYVIFGRATSSLNRIGTDIDDILSGGDWDDVFTGRGGEDFIRAGAGDDSIFGGADNDTLDGGTGDDEVYGGSGNDRLEGGTANDFLSGGSGNDTLIGGTGADDMRGGSGNDIYFTDGIDSVVEAASSGTDTVRSTSTNLTLGSNLERLILLGTANINGTGNNLANIITGNAGNNILDGGAGNDTLIGDSGRDTLTGSTGGDRFKFAAGDSGQTAATMDKITDFAKGAVNTGDRFDFTALLSTGGSATTTTINEASINQATGVATFNAGSGTTMADALNDIALRFSAATNSAGEFAFFKVNNTGAFHIFVSDGVAGVTANDVMVQLTGIITIGSINLTGGDLTILT